MGENCPNFGRRWAVVVKHEWKRWRMGSGARNRLEMGQNQVKMRRKHKRGPKSSKNQSEKCGRVWKRKTRLGSV